jgi:uncharacterized membrane protein
MTSPARHFTTCLIAGVVALLPVGGAVLTVVWLEDSLSRSWRDAVGWYFPGLGLLLALFGIYLVGLFVTTLVGRWVWRRTNRAIERLPFVGSLYQSLKEMLGYDTGRERFFQGVVAVRADEGFELGLVTGEETGPGGLPHTLVFVPGSPNPTSGRLLLVDPTNLVRLDARAADALRTLVSMGKTPLAGQDRP